MLERDKSTGHELMTMSHWNGVAECYRPGAIRTGVALIGAPGVADLGARPTEVLRRPIKDACRLVITPT